MQIERNSILLQKRLRLEDPIKKRMLKNVPYFQIVLDWDLNYSTCVPKMITAGTKWLRLKRLSNHEP